MPSTKFNKIKDKLQAKNPIFAKYNNEANKRKLCPHVLGYKEEGSSETDGNERVLCYQLDGPPPVQGWRCFEVTLLEIIEPAPAPTEWVTPSDYNSKWQNSVQKPKHKV